MAYKKRNASTSRRGKFNNRRAGAGRKGPKKELIPVEKFIKKARPAEEQSYVATNSFASFRLTKALTKNLQKKSYVTPSKIQDQAIPLALTGADVVGIADTGTGKTASFAIPLVNRILRDYKVHGLILAPTRELAEQIEQEVNSLTDKTGIYSVLLIGGVPMPRQLRKLKRKPHIIIGTPGRIKDHLKRGSLDVADCQVLVLDEVDRMLDMGFVHDIKEILKEVPEERQSLFFSATMDDRVQGIIKQFSRDAHVVSVKKSSTSDNVEQNVVRYEKPEEKIEKLHDLLVAERDQKVIIFDETKRSVDKLSKELNVRGFRSASIHGNKTQAQRKKSLAQFKEGVTSILVATDVAARGIDVPGITYVINYTTPQSYADYTHRIGRVGRAGRMGYALTFVSTDEERQAQKKKSFNRNDRQRRKRF